MSKLNLALGALTGGGTGALDKIDGNLLTDGDAATVILDSGAYHYHLDATSGEAENSPYVIAPDTNAGTKRWILQTPKGPFSHVEADRSTSQLISDSTNTKFIFNTEAKDYLSEYNPTTGIFTATHPGTYLVNACITYDFYVWGTGNSIRTEVWLDGALHKRGPVIFGVGSTNTISATIGISLELTANQTIEIYTRHNRGSASNSKPDATWNWLTIDRIM